MKKGLVTLFILVAVLAVAQITGGIVYTVLTAENEARYTYVEATVKDVETEKGEDDSVTVKSITVTYIGADGEVEATMKDFPSKFSIGTTFTARYDEDPTLLSTESTDWFTPIFLIILGVLYALGDAIALLNRKNIGLYALSDDGKETSAEEDNWSLVDTDEEEKQFLNGSDSE